MQLSPNEIHIWSTALTLSQEDLGIKLASLSLDEQTRANRFHFPIHQMRFVAARSYLREILSLYLTIDSSSIQFTYTEHEKPQLDFPKNSNIQFNLSHSDDLAVIAITLDHEIGIDIEIVQESYNIDIAKRFFSPEENAHLENLPEAERMAGFYQLWSRKEAIIKAIGHGLSMPLTSFSVSLEETTQMIDLGGQTWRLIPIHVHSGFQSAVASNQLVKKISFWQLSEHHQPKLTNERYF